MPDFVDLNDASKSFLKETFHNLLDQVDNEAPEVLEQLRLRTSMETPQTDATMVNLAEIINDSTINPFNLTVDYLFRDKLME